MKPYKMKPLVQVFYEAVNALGIEEATGLMMEQLDALEALMTRTIQDTEKLINDMKESK